MVWVFCFLFDSVVVFGLFDVGGCFFFLVGCVICGLIGSAGFTGIKIGFGYTYIIYIDNNTKQQI